MNMVDLMWLFCGAFVGGLVTLFFSAMLNISHEKTELEHARRKIEKLEEDKRALKIALESPTNPDKGGCILCCSACGCIYDAKEPHCPMCGCKVASGMERIKMERMNPSRIKKGVVIKVKDLVSLLEEPFDLEFKDLKTNMSEYVGWHVDIPEEKLEMEIASIDTDGLCLVVKE